MDQYSPVRVADTDHIDVDPYSPVSVADTDHVDVDPYSLVSVADPDHIDVDPYSPVSIADRIFMWTHISDAELGASSGKMKFYRMSSQHNSFFSSY